MIEAGRLAELAAGDGDAEAEYWRDQCAGVADILAGRPATGAARLGRIVGPELGNPAAVALTKAGGGRPGS